MIRKSSGRGNGGTLPRFLLLLTFFLASGLLAGAEELRLTFLGDFIPHGALEELDRRAFADLAPYLRTDDLTFLNLETPLHPGRPPEGYPNFNAHPSFLIAALDGGVEVVSAANNHSLDQGVEGVDRTREVLREIRRDRKTFYHSGLRGWNGDAPEPAVMEVEGYRIGYLSVTQFLNNWPPGDPERMLNLVDRRNRERFLASLRPEQYDFFILAYHGNALEEYKQEPEPAKLRFFRELAELGVDLIWGHHPHVPQPPIWVDRGAERSLILPSTGNFLTGQGALLDQEEPDARGEHAPRNDGYLFRITVAPAPASSRLRITGLDLIPFTNAPAQIPGGRKATTFDRAAAEAPSDRWRSYYRARERILRDRAASYLRHASEADSPVVEATP
ncbi:MAG: CapA family protein [Spirochaetaceae bacterium]